jgi:hypothetical protein
MEVFLPLPAIGTRKAEQGDETARSADGAGDATAGAPADHSVWARGRRRFRPRRFSLLTEVTEAMRHEANDRGATLHGNPGDPTRFLLHEIRADRGDVVNVEQAAEKGLRPSAEADSLLCDGIATHLRRPEEAP